MFISHFNIGLNIVFFPVSAWDMEIFDLCCNKSINFQLLDIVDCCSVAEFLVDENVSHLIWGLKGFV